MFAVDSTSAVESAFRTGRFGVRQPLPLTLSKSTLETFADYATIEPGDFVFFFVERKLYGMGRVITPNGASRGQPGSWLNWNNCLKDLQADPPSDALLPDVEATTNRDGTVRRRCVRIVVFFEPHPSFLRDGLDMDEILSHPLSRPQWALRFFEDRSFVRLEPFETHLLASALLRRRSDSAVALVPPAPPKAVPFDVQDLIVQHPDKLLHPDDPTRFKNEYILHALIAQILVSNPDVLRKSAPELAEQLECSGNLTLLHEYPASPPKPKPSKWARRIDLLRIREDSATGHSLPLHWDVIECKAGDFTGNPAVKLAQLLQYCDFTARQESGGDYRSISGHQVAHTFKDFLISRLKKNPPEIQRSFILDKDEGSLAWRGLYLWEYKWNPTLQALEMSLAWASRRDTSA